MTDITHDRVLGISVNIPTETLCPLVRILFVNVVSIGLGWLYRLG